MDWSAELMRAYESWVVTHGNLADPEDLRKTLQAVAERHSATAEKLTAMVDKVEAQPAGPDDDARRQARARAREQIQAVTDAVPGFIEVIVADYRQNRETLESMSGERSS